MNKQNKFEVPTDRFLSETITFHQTQNIMKNLRINDENIAKALSITLRDSSEDEVNDFINNITAEKQLIQNDLEILENVSETFEICSVCHKREDKDEDELAGECCNFCNASICSSCFDKVVYEKPMYGWVCNKC